MFAGMISLMLGAAFVATLLIQIEERTWHKLSPVETLVMAAPLLVLYIWWQSRVVPLFCRFRLASSSEVLNFPISLAESQKQ